MAFLFGSLTTSVITLNVTRWMPHLGTCLGGRQRLREECQPVELGKAHYMWKGTRKHIEFPRAPKEGLSSDWGPSSPPRKAWYWNQEEAEWVGPVSRGHGEAWPSIERPIYKNKDQLRTTKPPLSTASHPWQQFSVQIPRCWKEEWRVEKGGKFWTDGV